MSMQEGHKIVEDTSDVAIITYCRKKAHEEYSCFICHVASLRVRQETIVNVRIGAHYAFTGKNKSSTQSSINQEL